MIKIACKDCQHCKLHNNKNSFIRGRYYCNNFKPEKIIKDEYFITKEEYYIGDFCMFGKPINR